MIRGVAHVALITPNFDRLLVFYRDAIGFEELSDSEDASEDIGRIVGLPGTPRVRTGVLRLGAFTLVIQQYLEPQGSGSDVQRSAADFGIGHIALDVVGIEAECSRLTAAGMQFHGPPQRIGESWKAIYGRDPDGNILELVETLETLEPREPAASPG